MAMSPELGRGDKKNQDIQPFSEKDGERIADILNSVFQSGILLQDRVLTANRGYSSVFRYTDTDLLQGQQEDFWHQSQEFVQHWGVIRLALVQLLQHQYACELYSVEFDEQLFSAGVIAGRALFLEDYRGMQIALRATASPKIEQKPYEVELHCEVRFGDTLRVNILSIKPVGSSGEVFQQETEASRGVVSRETTKQLQQKIAEQLVDLLPQINECFDHFFAKLEGMPEDYTVPIGANELPELLTVSGWSMKPANIDYVVVIGQEVAHTVPRQVGHRRPWGGSTTQPEQDFECNAQVLVLIKTDGTKLMYPEVLTDNDAPFLWAKVSDWLVGLTSTADSI